MKRENSKKIKRYPGLGFLRSLSKADTVLSMRKTPSSPLNLHGGLINRGALDLWVDSFEHGEPNTARCRHYAAVGEGNVSVTWKSQKCICVVHPVPTQRAHVQHLMNAESPPRPLGQALRLWKGSKAVTGFHIPRYIFPNNTVLFFQQFHGGIL